MFFSGKGIKMHGTPEWLWIKVLNDTIETFDIDQGDVHHESVLKKIFSLKKTLSILKFSSLIWIEVIHCQEF